MLNRVQSGDPPSLSSPAGQAGLRWAGPLRIPAATFNTPARRSLGGGGFVDAANAIVKKPVAVYIEKVYEEGDFAGLGIVT